MTDVTDATFPTAVIERSKEVPVVVDLWAPWCGPCRTLGPMLEQVIGETEGKVELAKVNVDENPQVSAAFQVQSIPAVFALKDAAVVDQFIGAQPEGVVREFVDRLLPTEADDRVAALVADGSEAALEEALALAPDDERAVLALAEARLEAGRTDEALELLERIPESPETRRLAARARTGEAPLDDVPQRLDALLERVKDDEEARQEYVDLLELLGPDDDRTAGYRRALASRLY